MNSIEDIPRIKVKGEHFWVLPCLSLNNFACTVKLVIHLSFWDLPQVCYGVTIGLDQRLKVTIGTLISYNSGCILKYSHQWLFQSVQSFLSVCVYIYISLYLYLYIYIYLSIIMKKNLREYISKQISDIILNLRNLLIALTLWSGFPPRYKILLIDARTYELKHHDIILCTCTQSSTPSLTKTASARQILIDECGMATEPQALIPLVCNNPEKVSFSI